MLLAYFTLVVAGIVLAPFQFAVPERLVAHVIVPESGWVADLLLNVGLFLPLGFIGRRIPGLGAGPARRWLWVGLGLSLLLESAQLFLAVRYPTLTDVLANAAGAWLGAVLSDRAAGHLGSPADTVRRLLLDLPLVGAAYLLIPVVWLDGLAPGPADAGLWLSLPLAAAGGVAVAGAARTAEAADRGLAGVVAVLAAVWWLVAALPLLTTDPFVVVVGLTLTITVAQVADPLWRWRRRRDRRLEPIVVAVVLGLLLLYLASGGRVATMDDTLTREAMLRWLARGVAVTACGYLVAEWFGRREWPLVRALLVPAAAGGAIGWWLGGVLPAALMASLGAALYVLQRDHVVALRNEGHRPGQVR